MTRAALLREKFRPRRRRLVSPRSIRFTASLAGAQGANTAAISGYEIAVLYPGRAVIFDTAQGGLLALGDQAASGLAAADAGLYRVQISESV